eukprot:2182948-Rhodomonas_salina.1
MTPPALSWKRTGRTEPGPQLYLFLVSNACRQQVSHQHILKHNASNFSPAQTFLDSGWKVFAPVERMIASGASVHAARPHIVTVALANGKRSG